MEYNEIQMNYPKDNDYNFSIRNDKIYNYGLEHKYKILNHIIENKDIKYAKQLLDLYKVKMQNENEQEQRLYREQRAREQQEANQLEQKAEQRRQYWEQKAKEHQEAEQRRLMNLHQQEKKAEAKETK